jgi:hypothetical protein
MTLARAITPFLPASLATSACSGRMASGCAACRHGWLPSGELRVFFTCNTRMHEARRRPTGPNSPVSRRCRRRTGEPGLLITIRPCISSVHRDGCNSCQGQCCSCSSREGKAPRPEVVAMQPPGSSSKYFRKLKAAISVPNQTACFYAEKRAARSYFVRRRVWRILGLPHDF